MPRDPAQEFLGHYGDIPSTASAGLRFAKAFLAAMDSVDPVNNPYSFDNLLSPGAFLSFKFNRGHVFDQSNFTTMSFQLLALNVLVTRRILVARFIHEDRPTILRDQPSSSDPENRVVGLGTKRIREAKDYDSSFEDTEADETMILGLVPADEGCGVAGYQLSFLQLAVERY